PLAHRRVTEVLARRLLLPPEEVAAQAKTPHRDQRHDQEPPRIGPRTGRKSYRRDDREPWAPVDVHDADVALPYTSPPQTGEREQRDEERGGERAHEERSSSQDSPKRARFKIRRASEDISAVH